MANEDTPFLTTVDKNPFPIKYISFASWGRTEGLYFFDCHTAADENTDELTPGEPVAKTIPEQMFSDLFKDYDVSVPPAAAAAQQTKENLEIYIQIDIERVSFVTKTSVLMTKSSLRMVKIKCANK